MADKQMEYVGTVPLVAELPSTGGGVKLVKGDVVDYDEWGGAAFFGGRTDFKEHTKAKAAAKKPKGE